MRKLLFSVLTLLIMTTVSFGELNVSIPPSGGGGGGGGTSASYGIIYVYLGDVLESNGYDVATPFEYIGATAISPDGNCVVTRIHNPIWEVAIYCGESSLPQLISIDFFLKVKINGVTKELRYITRELVF